MLFLKESIGSRRAHFQHKLVRTVEQEIFEGGETGCNDASIDRPDLEANMAQHRSQPNIMSIIGSSGVIVVAGGALLLFLNHRSFLRGRMRL